MAVFENPNHPTQPQKGVYGWYAQKDRNDPITIYIGMAGGKESFTQKGTLFRGVSELQRNTFAQGKYESSYLDTDFIVGTAIIFFQTKGYSCVWKHLSNEPGAELQFVSAEMPILQNARTGKIRAEFRMKKKEGKYWDARSKVKEAESAIFSILEQQFANISFDRTPLRSAV
jgi:hypothetical protein